MSMQSGEGNEGNRPDQAARVTNCFYRPSFATPFPLMVSFQCDACCDVVKKPKLDQHRMRCWATFTCIDCSTTFQNQDYKSHTSCISEAEKYQKSVYKAPKQKGNNSQNGNKNPNGDKANGAVAPAVSNAPVSIVSELKSKTSEANDEAVGKKGMNGVVGKKENKKRKKDESDSDNSSDSDSDSDSDSEDEAAKKNGKKQKLGPDNGKEKKNEATNGKVEKQKLGPKNEATNGKVEKKEGGKAEKKAKTDKKVETREWDDEKLNRDYAKSVPLADTELSLSVLRKKVVKKFKTHPQNKAKKVELAEKFDAHIVLALEDGKVLMR
ncbi:hypothetical protein BC936DRAFT_139474 [Jimgerdemannia flammicorona]|uniref:Zinc finger C2H2 LYAR-type domain-containing protein n=1 Tax=Jimgerdemannia flammicorona TaxID=994334 RepID=A0A433B9Z5_9FUNG|nr:hypothetical protein BC936DRAFT_139474 [Jimgerdemannia flammicorona]